MLVEYIKARSTEDGDCWIWNLACSGNGTPKLMWQKKQWGARRLVAMEMGLNIEGKFVTTKCGNQRCVCPDHVLVVTRKQMDKLIVERTGHPYRIERRKKISDAQRKRVGKLTDEIVAQIRAAEGTHEQISARMGIAKSTVGAIRRHEKWKIYTSPFNGLGAR